MFDWASRRGLPAPTGCCRCSTTSPPASSNVPAAGTPAERFSNVTQPDPQSPAANPPPAALEQARAAGAALGLSVRQTETMVPRRIASERASSKEATNEFVPLEVRVVDMSHCIEGMAAATRIAPIVITTSSSTNVKPRECIDTSFQALYRHERDKARPHRSAGPLPRRAGAHIAIGTTGSAQP